MTEVTVVAWAGRLWFWCGPRSWVERGEEPGATTSGCSHRSTSQEYAWLAYMPFFLFNKLVFSIIGYC